VTDPPPPPNDDRRALLADLQCRIRNLESGVVPPDGEATTPGVARRIRAVTVARRARAEARERAERDRAAFEAAMAGLLHRVSTRPPPPDPPAPPRRGAILPEAAAPPLPHWSPTAIPGYRMWEVRDGLLGYVRQWTTPSYTAGCVRRNGREVDDPHVPHTDGSCGRPPCGIYAAKHLGDLGLTHAKVHAARRRAFGLVALSGKVVEHERGYRAAHAATRAIVVVGGGMLVPVADPDLLHSLFADTEPTLAELDATRAEIYDPGLRTAVARAAEFLAGHLWA
jgi:hypothetical protein